MWYHAVLIRCLCRSVGETLISMPRHPIEAAREVKLAQQGYCCLHQQAREHYGVSLPALVRKPDQYSRTGQQ